MKLSHALSTVLFLALTPLTSTWAQNTPEHSPANVMAHAAQNFLAALTADQQAAAIRPFDETRTDWHFVPAEGRFSYPRPGIRLKDLSATQILLAHAFLSSGLSQTGYIKATTIMSLEEILHDLEKDMDTAMPERNPGSYFIAIFGEPANDHSWGWNIQGHHISLHFTVVDGERIATAPTFLGTNPAEVKSGPRKGLRVLAHEEDMARALLNSLDGTQKAKAVISTDVPRDIFTSNKSRVGPLKVEGLSTQEMNSAQRQAVIALLEEYAGTMPAALAAARMEKVGSAGVENIVFAWIGSAASGAPHYYRLQGPTFLVEYDNVQNNANHIHTVWRDFDGDFGADLLTEHHKNAPDHQD
jgi:hypothetical protein